MQTAHLSVIVIMGLIAIMPGCGGWSAKGKTRQATVSAGWLPQQKNALLREIERCRTLAQQWFYLPDGGRVRAVIVPHAGIAFSGIAAASAYNALTPGIKRILLIAPSHTTAFNGIAVPSYTTYCTTLGTICLDRATLDRLATVPPFFIDDKIQEEHSIDIQLPFIQTSLGNVSVIPLIVGHLTAAQELAVIEELQKLLDSTTLLLVTTDLVHYGTSYGYTPFSTLIAANLKSLESVIVESILTLDDVKFSELMNKTSATVCGKEPVHLLLKLINDGGLGNVQAQLGCYYASPHLTKTNFLPPYASNLCKPLNDSDVTNSVGYAGIVIREPKNTQLPMFSGYERAALLALAHATIEDAFSEQKQHAATRYPVLTRNLTMQTGAFVTLETKGNELRGCIGRTESSDPLVLTVASMANAAAFGDKRFKPLERNELENLIISITVLSKPHTIGDYKEIEIGKHGIILEKDGHSAVFLPSVPVDFHWNRDQTLEHLSEKAGLPKDAWHQGAFFKVFEGISLKEPF